LPTSNSSDIYNEAAQRFPNGTDTDASGDWTQGQASIGAANTGPSVTLSVSPATIAEAAGSSTVTATLSAATTQTVTVTIAANASSTATGGGTDYDFSSTTITITAGSLTGTATVTAVQDAIVESDETIVIDIINVTNGTEAGIQQATVTITDDDVAELSIVATTQAEEDATDGLFTYQQQNSSMRQ
jgi:fibronectin-binding autotransporter adhesin